MKIKKYLAGILFAACISVITACSSNPTTEVGRPANETTAEGETINSTETGYQVII